MKEKVQTGQKLLLIHLPPLPSKPNPRSRAERLGNFGKRTGNWAELNSRMKTRSW